jgi:endonuclease YncB( thermonuclease family)
VKGIRLGLLVGLLGMVVAISCAGSSEAAPTTLNGFGYRAAGVERVIDGDTFDSPASHTDIAPMGRIRLYGVDTPERGEECYEEAKERLRHKTNVILGCIKQSSLY